MTLPNLSIHYGRFLPSKVWLPYAKPTPEQVSPSGEVERVQVMKTEEKGSDVNLATHLLVDAFQKSYEAAAIVTNDSDLYEPIRVVAQDLGFPVVIINPHRHPSRDLVSLKIGMRQIREGVLQESQFPDTLTDATGRISKPLEWR